MKIAAAAAGLFLLGLLGANTLIAGANEPPTITTTTTVTVEDKAKVRRLTRELASWKRTATKRERTIGKMRRATRAIIKSGRYGHWLESAFLCIHSHEGSWSDPNSPYWGGLQMDRDFMAAYGGPYYRYFGTADRWPASVQIAVAIHAYMSRGFGPWPNTRRMCGL